jgi:hypothetical protein
MTRCTLRRCLASAADARVTAGLEVYLRLRERDARTIDSAPTDSALTGTASATPETNARGTGLPLWLIVAGVAAGLALRLWVLRGPLGAMDSDESVSALVSRQILHGHYFAFIPQLEAGGTLMAWPRALVLWIFGPDRVLTKGIESATFALACLAVWRVGRLLFDERTGQLAGLLLWVYPAAAIWESTKVMLYYTPATVAGVCVMWLCVRLDRETRTTDIVLLGFVGGLSLWLHPMALYVGVPAVGWLIARRPKLLLSLWKAIPAALLGALPWIGFNLRHDFASLKQPLGPPPSTYSQRFIGFFDSLLPRDLGLRHFYAGDWFLPPFSVLLYAAVFVGLLVAVRRWHGPRTLLLTVAMAYPFVFAYPKSSIFNAEPRYGMPLLPTIALLLAYVAMRLPRPKVVAPAALAVAVLITGAGLHRVIQTTDAIKPAVLRSAPTGELWAYLERNHVEKVYAEYWVGYRLVWEDRQPLTVLPIAGDYYQLTVHSDGTGASTAVFLRGSGVDQRWIALMTKLGHSTQVDDVGAFVAVRTDAVVPVSEMLGVLDRPTGAN